MALFVKWGPSNLGGGGGGSNPLTIGTIDSLSPSANGAVISATQLVMQSASGTFPGLVNTGSQTFAGQKTFSTGLTGTLTGAASLNVLTSALGNLTDTGTDGITVTGGTGAVVGSVSLSQHVADTTHNGYLSSTDWNTFNNKQTALTLTNLTDAGTDGITITNGTGAVIGASPVTLAQHVADTTHNGYLSSTDWNTFNGKQASGNYITALTGDGSASGPGSASLTLAATQNNITSIPNLATVGTVTSGTWSATAIAAAKGGTGISTAASTGYPSISSGTWSVASVAATFTTLFETVATTLGDLVYGGASGAPTRLAGDTSNTKKFLSETSSAGVAAAPAWATIAAGDLPTITLTGDVTGSASGGSIATGAAATQNAITSIPNLVTVGTIGTGVWAGTTVTTAHGGTGVTSVTTAPSATAFAGWDANKNLSATNLIEGFSTTATGGTTTTLTVSSNFLQYFTGVTTQTVVLPATSTLVAGQSFLVVNNSTGAITVQSSGNNTIQAMAASTQLLVTCISTSGTGTASWSWTYQQSGSTTGNMTVDTFNGDGSTAAFTLSVNPGSLNNTAAFISGVYQQKTQAYSISGTTLTFVSAPPAGTNNIQVVSGSTLSIGTPADGTVTAAKFASGTGATLTQANPGVVLSAGQLLGTNTNDNATAGYVGEYLSSTSAGTPTNFPGSNSWGDAGSITLTAGDWDVTLVFAVEDNSATVTANSVSFGISVTTGNSATGLIVGDNQVDCNINTISNSPSPGGSIANWRRSVSGSTIVYAKVKAVYTVGTPQYNYRLSARRVR